MSLAHWGDKVRIPVRAGYCCGLAALLIVLGCESLQNAVAEGDTRTISLHHIHTNENLTITYKVNGRYDEAALKKINWLLRDWRKGESIKMDPHLIDLVWDVYREVDAKQPIWVVCGYRSPATNAMLRKRSRGVAKHSQHMLGKAMDFYIPGVELSKLREAGLRAQRGGVGYYPTSGSPFVHLDTGSVRHWPHMPEAQLARVLAKGPLTHVASNDRQPTLAATNNPLESFKSLLDRISGHSSAEQTVAEAAPKAADRPGKRPAAKPTVLAAVPLPVSRPTSAQAPEPGFELASAESKPVELRPSQAASLVAQTQATADQGLFSERGLWHAVPLTQPAQKAPQAAETAVAAATQETTGSLTPWPMLDRKRVVASAGALAYAPTSEPTPRAHPAPMGKLVNRPPAPQPDTTIALKRHGNQPSVVTSGAPSRPTKKRTNRLNDPWMRAMIVSPSALSFMTTARIVAPDYRTLSPYLHKPTSSVMMTFSGDPYLGMTADRFTGSAVVFVSTVTYSLRTAALQ
jgi:uncharacterized protein YcbK (DUF882 family)